MLNRGSVDGQIGDDPVHQGLVNREPVYSTLDFVCVLRQIVRQAGGIIMSKKSQELRMLSSVTLNCQETKTVRNSGSQLSE